MGFLEQKPASVPTDEEIHQAVAELDIRQNAVSKEIVPLKDSPALNKMLLKNARRSLNDIAAMTGLDVAEVSERLTVLYESGSYRDDLQEEKLLLLEVGIIISDVRERMGRLNMDDEAWASMARVQLSGVKTLLEQLEKRRKAIDGKLALITLQQARLIGDSIQLATERAAFNLAKKYGIPEEEVYAEFEEEYPAALNHLEKASQ
jgi:uncharacterized protein YidB (DUF937 family)